MPSTSPPSPNDRLAWNAARVLTLSIAGLFVGTACDKPTQGATQKQPSEPNAQVVTDQAKLHELGETARDPHFELRVKNVKTCSVEPHFQPPAGVRKLGVELEIVGLTGTQVPVNPFYAIVEAEDGTRFEATLAGCTPMLEATRIISGQRASGWVTFDVPDEMRAAELSYSPVMIGAKRSAVIFSLQL